MLPKILAMQILAVAVCGSAEAANGVDLYHSCGTGTRAFFSGGSCQNFINGVVGGIASSPHPMICFPAGYDGRQSLPIVQAYMRAHPEALNVSETDVIRNALRSAYPCG